MNKLSLLVAITLIATLGLFGNAMAASKSGTANVEVLNVVSIDPYQTDGDIALDFGKVIQPQAPATASVTIGTDGSSATGDNLAGTGGSASTVTVSGTVGTDTAVSATASGCSLGISLAPALSASTVNGEAALLLGGTMTIDSAAAVGANGCTVTVAADY